MSVTTVSNLTKGDLSLCGVNVPAQGVADIPTEALKKEIKSPVVKAWFDQQMLAKGNALETRRKAAEKAAQTRKHLEQIGLDPNVFSDPVGLGAYAELAFLFQSFLITDAITLGIEGADKMGLDELKDKVAAAKAEAVKKA